MLPCKNIERFNHLWLSKMHRYHLCGKKHFLSKYSNNLIPGHAPGWSSKLYADYQMVNQARFNFKEVSFSPFQSWAPGPGFKCVPELNSREWNGNCILYLGFQVRINTKFNCFYVVFFDQRSGVTPMKAGQNQSKVPQNAEFLLINVDQHSGCSTQWPVKIYNISSKCF